MKFQVRQTKHDDIEVSKFELLNAKTRSLIALNILGAGIAFLAGSAIYGLWQGNFIALKEVFIGISMPLGAIIGYYFGVKND